MAAYGAAGNLTIGALSGYYPCPVSRVLEAAASILIRSSKQILGR